MERDVALETGAGWDGTTGRSVVSGRRTHIIQILRDSKQPISAGEVAEAVDVHLNTARFHLENLVEAGLARRTAERRTTPGRPRTLYSGTLPNQTHERAQGYRVLAESLTTTLADHDEAAPGLARAVGHGWGESVIHPHEAEGDMTDTQARERVVAKMDALWFAPEISSDDPNELVMHNCPFLSLARRRPDVTCALHAGLVDGSLAALGSGLRVDEIRPLDHPHTCHLHLALTSDGQDLPLRLTYEPERLGAHPAGREPGAS